jgi:hypothetical protein
MWWVITKVSDRIKPKCAQRSNTVSYVRCVSKSPITNRLGIFMGFCSYHREIQKPAVITNSSAVTRLFLLNSMLCERSYLQQCR